MTFTTRHLRTARVVAAGLIASAVLVAGPADAAGLRIQGEPATQALAVGVSGSAFTVINSGPARLDAVRLFANAGVVLDCDTRTAAGRPFAQASSLAAGDRVGCAVYAVDADRGAINVIVAARDGGGRVEQRRATFMTLGGATPPQGIIVLAAGAIHDDTDADGLLDAGEAIAYDYTVINDGTLAVAGIALTDTVGAVTCPQSTLAVGAHMTCTRTYLISAGDDALGEVVNEIEATATDANGDPLIAADLVVTLDLAGDAGISVFKSPLLLNDADGSGSASAGDVVRYTFVVKNTNAQSLSAIDLVEPDPTLIDAPIACAGTTLDGAPFSGLGTGMLGSQDVILCTAPHTITAGEASVGIAQNLVEAYGQPAIGAQVFATGASAVVIPTAGDVTLVKSLADESGNQAGVAEPGETLTYTITLTNSGGSDVPAFAVTDVLDVNTTFVSADNGGTHAGGVVDWAGVFVPANGSVVLTVVVTVNSPLPPGLLRIANVAHETGTPAPPCPPAGEACVVLPTIGSIMIDKAVTDANGNGLAEPGETLTYTITLGNDGGSDVIGIDITDPLDPNTVFVSADNGGTHAGGVISWSGLTVAAGATRALTVIVTVVDPLPLDVTSIANSAFESDVSPPDCDAKPQPDACAIIPVAGTAQIAVVKTVDSATAVPGGAVLYTITVSNAGNTTVEDVTISDPIPVGIASFAWTCAASGGAACGAASGTGAIVETLPAFPSGGEVIYTINAQLSAAPPSSIVNAVTVTPGDLVTCVPDDTQSPCMADVSVSVVGTPPGPVVPVPVDGRWALLALSLLMLGMARRRLVVSRR